MQRIVPNKYIWILTEYIYTFASLIFIYISVSAYIRYIYPG